MTRIDFNNKYVRAFISKFVVCISGHIKQYVLGVLYDAENFRIISGDFDECIIARNEKGFLLESLININFNNHDINRIALKFFFNYANGTERNEILRLTKFALNGQWKSIEDPELRGVSLNLPHILNLLNTVKDISISYDINRFFEIYFDKYICGKYAKQGVNRDISVTEESDSPACPSEVLSEDKEYAVKGIAGVCFLYERLLYVANSKHEEDYENIFSESWESAEYKINKNMNSLKTETHLNVIR